MDEFNLWLRLRERLHESCSHFDGLWIKRRRAFDTEAMVRALLHLVGDSHQSYHRVMDQMDLEGGLIPAASSFCEARAKLPAFILSELRQDVLEAADEHLPGRRWHGYRVHAVDGTRVTLPRPLLKQGFRIPGTGHYPQGLVSLLVRLDDRAVCDISLAKREDERHEAHGHLAYLSRGDLVVYDRGYLSFSLLVAHVHQGIGGVFRVAKGTSFLPIDSFWKSQKQEAIVTIDPLPPAYRKTQKRYPDIELGPIQLRLIKYKIAGETYVLATTILEPHILRGDFVDLYSCRWWSEETFKTYKQTLDLEAFHAKSERGVRQELEATALLWNLARVISSMTEPAIKKKSTFCLNPSHYQVNFQQSVLKVARSLNALLSAGKVGLERLLLSIVAFLARSALPIRPGRSFPRRSLKPEKKWRRLKPRRKKPTGRPRGRPRKATC